MLQPSKEESIRLALAQAERYAEKKKWKAAIGALNQALDKGISNDKLLLQKGLLLGKTHQFKEAQKILRNIINNNNKSILTKEAKEALFSINVLQKEVTESSRLFLKQLHDLINKQNQRATHLPDPQLLKTGQDLSTMVRKEAALARNQHHYSLSLRLLSSGIEHGLKSDWLFYEKSLTLKAIGQFQAAEAILNDLAKTKGKGKDRLIQTAEKTLQNLGKERKQFAKFKTSRVLDHLKSIATEQTWPLRRLPLKAGKRGDREIQKLCIEEAKAAFNANQSELCLALMEAMLLYYPENQQSQILKARAEINLGRKEQAMEALKQVAPGDGKFALIARAMLGEIWLETALKMDVEKSPQKAIHFFISQHLDSGINPEYTPKLNDALMQLNPSEELHTEPDLRLHQLNVRFNGQLIDLLEARLLQQTKSRPRLKSTAQTPHQRD